MTRISELLLRLCTAAIPILGIGWIFSVTDYMNLPLTFQQVVGVFVGLSTAAALIKFPYGSKAGALDIVLALIAFFAWFWMAWNFEPWIVGMADRTLDKWVPGVFAIVLMIEALRKSTGNIITILVWVFIAYAFLGDYMPGALEAEVAPPTKTIMFLYADNNGIPGLVLQVIANLVLAFILFGQLLQVSGGSAFFNDVALSLMGHRRGGPAKVAVVASSAFGMISGSTVGNIMSTGVVTIPLMKRAGFKPHHAAAIEAVASNGGQIAPPVMGATAFIIAEFLEIPYADVVIAAAVPAFLYYLVLFLQVDAIAVRYKIKGVPKAELPRLDRTLIEGWIFVIPLAVLLYYLFGKGYNPGLSAMYACAALFLLMVVKQRRLPTKAEVSEFIFGGGDNLIGLILIGGAAGVVIGVLNSTGLAFQLSLILTSIGEDAGILAMLCLTGLICIILGMGMPTAAVYIVLAVVVAPALVEMGVKPLPAHMFIFYFGLLSMLTPPVAVASIVAANLAGSGLWRTGFVGMQLAAAAYLLPFLWVFNPALLWDGTVTEIVYVLITAISAGLLLSRAAIVVGTRGMIGKTLFVALLGGGIAVGSATLWLGTESPMTLIPAALGTFVYYVMRERIPLAAAPSPAE